MRLINGVKLINVSEIKYFTGHFHITICKNNFYSTMLIFDFFIYIFLVIIWLIYIANSLHLNYKMNHFMPNKKMEVLTIPFYIFAIISFFILAEGLIPIFFNGELRNIKNIFSFNLFSHIQTIIILMKTTGIIFGIISVAFYSYMNFSEKSFPSCLTIKNGGQLKGIYNYIRHPSYYIFFFITFGTALCLTNLPLFILACINHVCLYFYYMAEENQIRKTNINYDEYLKRTNRFLPNFFKTLTSRG